MQSLIYLIPCVLEESATETIPPYIIDAVKNCQVIFAENERTARRFLKSICKEIVIDDYEWFTIHKAENEVLSAFRQKIKEGNVPKNMKKYGNSYKTTGGPQFNTAGINGKRDERATV